MIKNFFKYLFLNYLSDKNYTSLNYNIMEKRFIESLSIKSNDLIIDVGSHEGESVSRFLGINKNVKIHSFEPNEACYQKSLKKYQGYKNIFLNNIALGKKKSVKIFNINNNSQTSSFYKVNKKFKFEDKKFKTIRQKKIVLDTLDNYCFKNKINSNRNNFM